MRLRSSVAIGLVFIMVMLVRLSSVREAEARSARGALLQPMLEALQKSGRSASLEFSSHCNSTMPPDLPRMRIPKANEESLLQTLHEVLADDSSMVISEEADGVIRMAERDVPKDILNLRIAHISFDGVYGPGESGVNNPNEALHIILGAPEVVSFTKSADIEVLFTDYGIGSGPSSPADAHISGSWDNLTVAQALDRVLGTFPGIWVYEHCGKSGPKQMAVFFRFFYLRNIGTGNFVEG